MHFLNCLLLFLDLFSLGNAWVDPLNQYPAYPEFAYETKMINEAEYKEAKENFEQCVTMIENELWQAPVFCDNVFANLLGKRNPFNIRLKCEVSAKNMSLI